MIYFVIAARNLWQAKRRTALLTTALALVTTLLVMLMALSDGVADTMVRSATRLSSGHVNVAGFYKVKQSDSTPLVNGVKALREIVKENTPGLDYVIDRQRGWGRIISDTGSVFAGLNGIDVDEEQGLLSSIQLASQLDYKEGGSDKVLGDTAKLREPNTILIFAAQAKRLGVDVGDMLTLSAQSMSGATNTGEVRIVAVAKDIGFMSNWSTFTAKETVRALYQLQPDTTGAVMVYLKDATQGPVVMEHLRGVLKEKGYEIMEHSPQPFWMKFETVGSQDWTGQRLDLTTWEDEMGQLKSTLTGIQYVSTGLVSVLLVIIVIGIMNAMWIAVRERTGEIVTLRAIGMQRRQVLSMFVTEATLLGIFATGLGAILGLIIATILEAVQLRLPSDAARAILMSDFLHLVVEAPTLVKAVIAFTIVTILAALWPAMRAARMRPVTAIHHAA